MSTQPLFDMSKATPIGAQGGAPLFDMSKAKPIGADSAAAPGFWDTLKREGKSMVGTIAGMPSSVYHAFSEPPTDEEKQRFGLSDKPDSMQKIALGTTRMSYHPAVTAGQWYGEAAQGKIPNAYEQALSVAPEAMGSAAGNVVAGKLAESVPGAVRAGAEVAGSVPAAVKPVIAATGRAATAVGESLNPDLVGLVSPRLAHALRLAGRVGKAATSISEAAPAEALDATVENKPYAGEKTPPVTESPQKPPPLPDELSAARRAAAPTPPKVNRQLQDLINFRPSIERIIDDAVPPKGETYRDNLIAKAAVDQHLEQGNVQAAQQVVEHLKAEAPKAETPQTPEAPEAPVESPYKQYTPEQWKKFDERLSRIFEKVKNEPKQETAPATATEEDLTPLLEQSLKMIEARKNFVEQNPAH